MNAVNIVVANAVAQLEDDIRDSIILDMDPRDRIHAQFMFGREVLDASIPMHCVWYQQKEALGRLCWLAYLQNHAAFALRADRPLRNDILP